MKRCSSPPPCSPRRRRASAQSPIVLTPPAPTPPPGVTGARGRHTRARAAAAGADRAADRRCPCPRLAARIGPRRLARRRWHDGSGGDADARLCRAAPAHPDDARAAAPQADTVAPARDGGADCRRTEAAADDRRRCRGGRRHEPAPPRRRRGATAQVAAAGGEGDAGVLPDMPPPPPGPAGPTLPMAPSSAASISPPSTSRSSARRPATSPPRP